MLRRSSVNVRNGCYSGLCVHL